MATRCRIATSLADAFLGDSSSDELLEVQGSPADIGGYYRPDAEKAAAVMRPSTTFNEVLASL
jgi:isocitrate dehydrogenase